MPSSFVVLNPVDIDWLAFLTIIDTKRRANPIISLPIGDSPGSLGNVRHLERTLCPQRMSMGFHHTDSACSVRLWDLLSRVLCLRRMSTRLESLAKRLEYIYWTENNCLDARYHGNGIYELLEHLFLPICLSLYIALYDLHMRMSGNVA